MDLDEMFHDALSELADIDCHDTNLRDNPAAYAVLDRLSIAIAAAQREACAKVCDEG